MMIIIKTNPMCRMPDQKNTGPDLFTEIIPGIVSVCGVKKITKTLDGA